MNNPIYINGTGIISPQGVWDHEGITGAVSDHHTQRLSCEEPEDYSPWISPQYLRRMSRVLKMGAASAVRALQDASVTMPDAIITGTGYGCLEDTASFLTKIAQLQEQALNPTPFMQSTHNTIGSQLALMLGCQGYNQTYTHQAFSFEHALQDTLLMLAEYADRMVLTGGVDELTAESMALHSRFKKYRKEVSSSLALFKTPGEGTLAGEGAAWFVLSGNAVGAQAEVQGLQTYYRPLPEALPDYVAAFLMRHQVLPEAVDLVLVGTSGDVRLDAQYDHTLQTLFKNTAIGAFKHLCGEYCVASSFGMWLAVQMLHKQYIPGVVRLRGTLQQPRTVLVYNTYFKDYHSLILLKSCHAIKN